MAYIETTPEEAQHLCAFLAYRYAEGLMKRGIRLSPAELSFRIGGRLVGRLITFCDGSALRYDPPTPLRILAHKEESTMGETKHHNQAMMAMYLIGENELTMAMSWPYITTMLGQMRENGLNPVGVEGFFADNGVDLTHWEVCFSDSSQLLWDEDDGLDAIDEGL